MVPVAAVRAIHFRDPAVGKSERPFGFVERTEQSGRRPAAPTLPKEAGIEVPDWCRG